MRIVLWMIFFFLSEPVNAQDFVTRGRIEYEVKINQRLEMFHNSNGELTSDQMSGIKEFSISHRELLFAGNQWTYKSIDKKPAGKNELSITASRNTGLMEIRKSYVGDQFFTLQDSLPGLRWKLESETRVIAGWQCRKAITKIFDSVYVIAFYCPEIVPQAGPELFNGLPGMILGLAIPRYYTTWFATRIELADVDESKIEAGGNKNEKMYSKKELAEILTKKYKEVGWQDATKEKVMEMLNQYVY